MVQGMVFNIQRYSIHDGPGIRTTVFLKSCPLRCFWCQNPESQRFAPEIFRDRAKCTGCGRCFASCPAKATTLQEGKIRIDRNACTGCGRCTAACPNQARRLVGAAMSLEEIMGPILRDRKYYENSGGGVTLSGGEAAAQPQFALALLQKCKEAALHTTLDTCGHAPWPVFEKLVAYTDLVLYDIKHLDAKKHKQATGQENRCILDNARRIARSRPMRVRVPLIPGFNDSVEEIQEISRFVQEALGAVPIDLLPYNKMGEGKYHLLDRQGPSLDWQDDSRFESLKDCIR